MAVYQTPLASVSRWATHSHLWCFEWSHVTSLLIPLSLYLSVCLSEYLLTSHIWLSNRLCNIMRCYGTEMSPTVFFIPLSATFNFLSVFFNHTFLLSFGVRALEWFRVCLIHFFSVRPFVFSTEVVFICIIALFLSLSEQHLYVHEIMNW